MREIPIVLLTCPRCASERLHEVDYAGPLLIGTVCAACGLRTGILKEHLYAEYVRNFEDRIRTKPGRVVREAVRDPRGFTVQLPVAVMKKPYRLCEEWLVLHHASHQRPDMHDCVA